MMKREKDKKEYFIYIILIVALIIKVAAIFSMGVSYNIGSDDMAYIESGITLIETGKITLHGYVSAQSMPLMTIIVGLFVMVFGKGTLLFAAIKITWMLIGLASIYLLYKTVRLFTGEISACFASLFLLAPDFIWMDNIILMETPYIFLWIVLIYLTFKFETTRDNKYFILFIISFILCMYLRPMVAIYPVLWGLYLLIKKVPFKELLKKTIIFCISVVLAFLPWVIRNYKVFDHFILFSYGMGNPKLLGTYQGYGYPLDEELDYKTNVDDKLTSEAKYYLYESNSLTAPLKSYYLLKYDEMTANYRISYWWKHDKKSMILSYLYLKPKSMIIDSFYWDKVFNIPLIINIILRYIDLVLVIISMIVIFINKKYIKELLLLIFTYGYNLYIYSYSFAYSRYAQSLLFLRFIIIGIGIGIMLKYIMKRRGSND